MQNHLFPILGVLAILAGASPVFAAKATDNPSSQIDQILEKSWKAAKVQGNPIASDEVFVRRIYLDAAGRIPTLAESTEFLQSDDKDKRAKLIQQLLSSEGYVNHYFNYWADILRINSQQGGGQNITPYYIQFVRDSLRENKPYDQFVREMITAEGQAMDNGAIGYTYRDRGMPLDHMANTVRIFLGTRLECAQCHNHPFDKWTQMDFFHMAAFSYGMGTNNRGGGYNDADLQRKLREMAGDDRAEQQNLSRAFQEISRPIRNNASIGFDAKRLPELPHDYQYDDAKPKDKVNAATMFGDNPEVGSDSGKIEAYADWMTSPKNPRFTTVIANRLWKEAMGRGLIEPVDELMDSTEPVNPELMSFLEDLMRESGYDMKAYLSAIFNSKAYQRESGKAEVDPGDNYLFTGPVLRRMKAEQVWDSLVALINPQPELGDWKRDQTDFLRVATQRQMQDALKSVPEEKLLEYTKEIAQYQKKLADETKGLTVKIEELRKAGKMEEARELSRKVNNSRNQIQSRVAELVYEPALKETKVELASFTLPDGESMDLSAKMIGSNGQGNDDLRKAQQKAEEALIEREMDDLGLEAENDRKQYANLRRNAGRYFRAAYLSSPAQNGHFLREFGQSDRETIENSSSDASVPQALNLMNGNDFPQLAGGNSILTWNLGKAETVEDKIDIVFESLLSRKPTEEEQQLLMAVAEDRGEEIVTDTVFALLNNQEFLFIQ